MGKKKTVFVWIILVLFVISLLFRTIGFISSLININKLVGSPLDIINFLLDVVSLVVLGILFLKLYNVKPDVLNWVYIAFGLSIINFVFFIYTITFISRKVLPLSFILPSYTPAYIVISTIVIFFWIGVILHLKRAKREKLMDFS